MADVTLKIDADTAQYIAKIARMADETNKAGKKAAQGFGSAMEQAVTGSLLKVELLKKAFRTVAQIADDIGRRGTEASKRTGDRAVNVATSLASLGSKNIEGTLSMMETTQGVSTTDQREAFVKRLADANASRRVKFRQEDVNAAIQAYSERGDLVYGEGGQELISGLERFQGVDAITKKSLAARPGLQGLGEKGRVATELGVRNVERTYTTAADMNRRERGDVLRAGAAYTEFRASQSLGAEAMQTIMEQNGGTTPVNYVNGQKQAAEVRDAIQTQTDYLKSQRQVNLSAHDPSRP